MANNKFKAAVKKAKTLYRTGRYKKFSDAVKAAYKKTGSKKRSSPAKRKPAARRRSKRRVGIIENTNVAGIGRISAGALRAELRRKLNQQIDKAVLQKYHATKKRLKTKIQKRITATKAQLRRLA